MNQAKLAEARRLYHHVCNGGTLTPKDVSFMVVALEEAYERGEEHMTFDPNDPNIKIELADDGLKRKRDADLKIGAWLSAALEDPSTCQLMKDDINEWFACTPQEKNI